MTDDFQEILDARIQKWQNELQAMIALRNTLYGIMPSPKPPSLTIRRIRKRGPKPGKGPGIVQRITTIMANGQAYTINQLYLALIDQAGPPIQRASVAISIQRAIKHNGQFERVAPGLYKLKAQS